MKLPNRVECDKCEHFIPAVLKDEGNLISPWIKSAKCKLGKRVMFRMPVDRLDSGGYFRYCSDFK